MLLWQAIVYFCARSLFQTKRSVEEKPKAGFAIITPDAGGSSTTQEGELTTMSKEKKGGSRLPFLQGVLPINQQRIPVDIIAGLTLAALGIPEVMGYTKIAGMPVVTGLYTLLLPVLVFAIFGSSRHLVVGADSATAAIIAAGLAGMAAQGSAQYVALAGAMAIIAAVFLILARIVRLGFLANFLSRSVLIGFLTGVGIQVAMGQVAGMLGVPSSGDGTIQKFVSALQHIPQTNIATLIISLSVLVIIIGSRMINKNIPGALIAVVGSIIASSALSLSTKYGVATLGPVQGGLPPIGLPQIPLTLSVLTQLTATALSIFFVVLAQSAATSRAYAIKYSDHFDENVDLIGLGLANVAAGISGTFAVNGSPTKTEIVDSAGGRSQVAQITTAFLVLIVLLFLTGPLAYMPSAVLSAVVFYIGVRLIDVRGMIRIYRLSQSEFVVAALTALVVVIVGVEQGIILAIVLSLIDHLRHSYSPFDAVLVPTPSGHWKATAVEQYQEAAPGLAVYHFGAGLYYANAVRFSEEILGFVEGAQPQIKWLDLDVSAISNIDISGADTAREVYEALQKRDVTLVLSGVTERTRKELDRYGLTKLIGEERFYDGAPEVLEAYLKETSQEV
ncbi:MAG TPA: SulP family inorganic anion transporter [Ktedonobacteraceae bacterium]